MRSGHRLDDVSNALTKMFCLRTSRTQNIELDAKLAKTHELLLKNQRLDRVQFDWLRRHSWDDRHGSCPRFDRSLVDVDIAIIAHGVHFRFRNARLICLQRTAEEWQTFSRTSSDGSGT